MLQSKIHMLFHLKQVLEAGSTKLNVHWAHLVIRLVWMKRQTAQTVLKGFTVALPVSLLLQGLVWQVGPCVIM